MYNKILEKIKNKNICILGFGMEGKSTYNFIRRHFKDMHITIIDKKDISKEIDDSNVEFICGPNYLDNLDIYDLIIKTPGVSLKGIDITNIKDKLTSQLELILEVFKDNTIGITGTKGKSTTSSLMYNILKDQGYDAYLLGNIGNAMLDQVESFNQNTYLVIEMSALQLEFVKKSPKIGVVLNLFEDHLDHAGSIYHYHEEKMNMFKYQDSNDFSIYSKDNKNTLEWLKNNEYLGKMYSVTLFPSKDSNTIYLENDNVILNNEILYNNNNERNLIGNHNLSNIMFALVISKILNLDMKKVLESIKEFKPLEHRIELVGTYNGITYYNDSIATIPRATINAIESLKDVDTLIFGGMDRGIEYRELVDYLSSSNIRNLICMPTTGYRVGKEIETRGTNKNIYYIEMLEDAVNKAKQVTEKGKICLMSPAASSYEYFKNFEEKGRVFKDLVRKDN